jgi:hypothetical protein
VPLREGADVGESIRELHGGKTYAKTKRKSGKKRANKQAIAIAFANRRKGKKRKQSTKRTRRMGGKR